MNVLMVEDDPAIARGLQVNLELEGFRVFWAADLRKAHLFNAKEELDLVILDLGLPDGSGFDFLTKLRSEGSRLPIIILTAKTDEDSVVDGLNRGAIDFMRKPFSNKELIARIKAVLRKPPDIEEQLRYGELLILVKQRVVKFKEQSLDLNRREFDIILYLMQRADTVVSRESLLQMIDKDGEIFDRTIDSHVSHIRTRLRQCGVISVKISSVYGVGYRMEKAQ
jgi:two-component system OmpR family response regulator